MAGQVARLLTHIWGQRSGYVFLPRKAGAFWIEQAGCYAWPTDLSRLSVPSTQNVYYCPLVFSRPERKAQYALPTTCLWSDLDEADPEQLSVRPSVAWRTTQGGFDCTTHNLIPELGWQDEEGNDVDPEPEKPHWQALWLLDREVTPDAAAELSRRIAYAEGADKGGWDVTQVLRLPGTYNYKHSPPQRIEMLWSKAQFYDPRQIALVYPRVEVVAANGTVEWPVVAPETLAAAKDALPMGIRHMLERGADGADRSMEILRMARTLLRCKIPRDVALYLLEGSEMYLDKFATRTDGRKVLLQTIENAAPVRLT